MQDVIQLKRATMERLDTLPPEKLIEVLDFVNFIAIRSPQPSLPTALPAPDAFLECAGTWEFEPGELEEILQDIEYSRLMELEEEGDGLFD